LHFFGDFGGLALGQAPLGFGFNSPDSGEKSTDAPNQ